MHTKASIHQGFSMKDFATLCILLRDEDRSRPTLTKTIRSVLSRMKLDGNLPREGFCTVVENLGNDPNVDTVEDFRDRNDGFNSDMCPLSFRTAENNQFNLIKRQFIVFRG